MSEWLLPWLSAFGLTQAVEVPIYIRALREREPIDDRIAVAFAIAFGASALTHPIVWFLMPRLITHDWLTMVLVAELFAITAEAAWLRAFGLGSRGAIHRGSSRRDFRRGRKAETPLHRAYCKFRRQRPRRKDQASCREGLRHGLPVRALAWAAFANAASVLVGLISRHLFGWP